MSGAVVNRGRRAFIGSSGTVALALCVSGVSSLAAAGRAIAAGPQHVKAPGADARRSDARRVVVIGGALAEIVYALNAQARLVGADTTCTYPDAARKLPKIGYQRALSAEGLLSLRPDLVLASAEAGPPAALSQVKSAGVAVRSFAEGHDADTVRMKINGIAGALDAHGAGTSLLARFDSEWQATRAAVAASPLAQAARTGKAPRVLFVLNHTGNQALVAGQRTAADAMLAYAGARNVMQGFAGYRPLTAEALIAAAPDVVLTTGEGLAAAGSAQALFTAPGFAETPAGRAQRLVSLDALFLLGFGPRLPAAVAALNQKLTAA
ncbi:hemin ABC transporter substrate-binding protein [Trinickia terrae]|uniref:Hemin ABC transporter substrate-binding protein n=1 Tax=Trinickia terrae TaxID=2571161 RepID=A0A4U1IF89_9BURK|nr:ABC transporter substrate-binding protein [Trinickia terrae]TKC92368.1 hemin ABC transporter substrate-binding protein [Trinickia terrae]